MKLRRASKRLLKTPQPNEDEEEMLTILSGMTPLWIGQAKGIGIREEMQRKKGNHDPLRLACNNA